MYLHQKMIRIYADIVQNHTLPGVFPNFWRAVYLRDVRKIKLRMVSSQHFINEARGAKASQLRSHRRATLAQITEKQCWSHRRPVRVPMMTSVHHRKHLQCSHEHQSWTVEQWKNAVLDLDSVLLGNLESKHVKSPCFQRCSDYSQYEQYSQSH